MPRITLFPPTLTLALSPPRLRALLVAHHVPRALAKLTGPALARALFGTPCDDALADALDLLARFASAAGKRALLDAASATGFSLDPHAKLPCADLAAHVLTARHDEPRLHGVVARGLLALAESELDVATLKYELVAREPRRPRPLADATKPLQAEGSWTDVWPVEDDHGAYSFALLGVFDPEVIVEVDSGQPRPRVSTRLRCDIVVVDVERGRVTVDTQDPRDVRAIVAAIGQALYDDASFFTDRPAFTTRPLEELGSAGLAAARVPEPVTRVRVIACTKELIGEGRQRATGSRAHALLEDGPRVAGGYLREVTLRLDIKGDDTPVDVDVRLPNRARCSSPRWQGVVRDAMGALGLLTPGALPDDAWSLFPVRRPDWRLRESLGDAEVFALLKSKALKRVLSRNVTTAELRAQGSNLLTFPVPGERGTSYAIPSDPSVAPRDVKDRDREVLELDVAKLSTLRAKEMGLDGEVRVRDGGGSVVLGVLKTRGPSLSFVALLRAPANAAERSALSKSLTAEAFPSHVVLLVPKGRAWDSGQFLVEYEGLVAGGRGLVERAVALARIEEHVDLWRLTDAPLVVHRAQRKVWFYETLMDLPDSGYAMVEGLALRQGEVSPTREVCKWISPAREDLQAARSTRPKLVKWMVASFEGAGKKAPIEEIEKVVVMEARGAYRLGVKVRVF